MTRKWRTGVLAALLALTLAAWVGVQWPGGAEDAAGTDAESLSEGVWARQPEAAFARAEKEGKPLLLDFYAQWCGICQHMEQTTLADESVQQRLRDFVAVKVDVDRHRPLAQAFGITGLPTTVIATPTGEPVRTRPGYMNVDEYHSLLSEASEAVRNH